MIEQLNTHTHTHTHTSAFQFTDFNKNLLSTHFLTTLGWCWDIKTHQPGVKFSSVQSLSRVQLFVTPWTIARQASLSITNSWSLFKLMSIESVMPSNDLILCHPPLVPPLIFTSIRVCSNESVLHIRWQKYWSFSFNISPSNDYSGLLSFRMDWLDLLPVQGSLKSLLQHHSSKASILWCSAFFIVQLSHPYMTTGKTIALTRRTSAWRASEKSPRTSVQPTWRDLCYNQGPPEGGMREGNRNSHWRILEDAVEKAALPEDKRWAGMLRRIGKEACKVMGYARPTHSQGEWGSGELGTRGAVRIRDRP